jgi:hypothetical protein
MQDTKEQGWTSEAVDAARAEHDEPDRESALHVGDAANNDGWQQYRKWISKTPAPRTRRTGLDPTLYTWKGYRNWTEQVKRNWNDQ